MVEYFFGETDCPSMDSSARVSKSRVYPFYRFCELLAFQVFVPWKNLRERTPKIRAPKIHLYASQSFHKIANLLAAPFACCHCKYFPAFCIVSVDNTHFLPLFLTKL